MSRISRKPEWSERLAMARRAAKLTLPKMAEALGVGLATLKRWEAGEQEPRLSHLAEYEHITGIDVSHLITGRSIEQRAANVLMASHRQKASKLE